MLRTLSFKLGFTFITILCCLVSYGQEQLNTIEISDVPKMLMGLVGGLTFFLFGMDFMSKGMRKVAGKQMRYFLSALTQNRFIGLLVGAIVTTVIQSSSATTVMLVGFVHSGLMSFSQTLGVILGADIGTTFTVQLVAFKVTNYALLMLSVGFGMNLISKNRDKKNWGQVIMGMGILFFGMKLMSDSMSPLKELHVAYDWLKGLENPFIGVFIGSFFTAIIQSSAAFIGVIIVLAQQKLISLDGGIALTLGANLGTCITAFLASINTSRDAKRVALGHVLFKVSGIIVFFFWIPTFADFIRDLSGDYSISVARQIANAHTLFNVGLALLFLPFTRLFELVIFKIIPEKKSLIEPIDNEDYSLHIVDQNLKKTPSMALNIGRMELSKMGQIIIKSMNQFIPVFVKDKSGKDKVIHHEQIIENLRGRKVEIEKMGKSISAFLLDIGKEEISSDQSTEVYALISIANDFQSIADVIERGIIPLIEKSIGLDENLSIEGQDEISIFHLKVVKQIGRLREAFQELDMEKANKIMRRMERNLDLESQYRVKHYMRMQQKIKKSVETHEIHMELLDVLKQINVYAGNMAKGILRISGS